MQGKGYYNWNDVIDLPLKDKPEKYIKNLIKYIKRPYFLRFSSNKTMNRVLILDC